MAFMNAFALTDVGMTRSENQDYLLCLNEPVGEFSNMFIVADGMGGHNAGDFASRFCVEEFVSLIKEGKGITPINKIDLAIKETNERLIEKAADKPEYAGMGTTFVGATVIENMMYVFNIGDSRLYVINDTITQITEDHSLVSEMVKNGELKKEEARFHPNKNIVTRAISANGVVSPDFFEVELFEKDIVLLCSDGLSTMLDDEEIFRIVQNNAEDLPAIATKLVSAANENGGKDNISVVLFRK